MQLSAKQGSNDMSQYGGGGRYWHLKDRWL